MSRSANIPGNIKRDLGAFQDLAERLLRENSYFIGPVDILEAVADALYTSEAPSVGYEVSDLIMRLRGMQIGFSKQSKPF